MITLILTAGFLEHKLSANVTNLMDGLRAVAGGDYSVRLKTDKHQLLDDLCEDFNRMTEELQSVRTLRENFVNSYSHEFRTPITAIKGFAELLSEPDLTEEERQQYLRIIQEESDRLAELTNRTLFLTKLESQRFVPDQTTFSLDEQIRRCAILLSHNWEEKHLTFSAELETVDCTGSEELLRQVWLNLLNNAIRYTPPGGEIGVELKRTGREAAVRVWDTGAGMTAEVQAHIFEKYYQGDPSEKKQGLGLGLSIVHRIVELSGGRIEAASQPQQGSSFTVYLPLIGEEACPGPGRGCTDKKSVRCNLTDFFMACQGPSSEKGAWFSGKSSLMASSARSRADCSSLRVSHTFPCSNRSMESDAAANKMW